MHTLTVRSPVPVIRRINLSAQAVSSAHIVGDICVTDDGRLTQEGSFLFQCLDAELDAFYAALRGMGCSILEDSSPPAPQVKEVVIVEEEPEEEVETEEEADLSVLDLSIGGLEEALESGDHDDQLDELFAAEEAGKTRKGAVAALLARMESL